MKAIKKERDPRVRVKTVKITKTPLTKQQMVSTMQSLEAAAFLELKRSERDYGTDASFTSMCRTRWAGINAALEALCIPQDFNLPDNVEAVAIINERLSKEQARTRFTISAEQ
jgi:hypothetical protein